jgi:hypothetical protein
LIQDLGGEDSISTQQRTMVELASTSKLLLGSIDALLLSQPSLFTRNKTVLPVIQRQQLADGLRGISTNSFLSTGTKSKHFTKS